LLYPPAAPATAGAVTGAIIQAPVVSFPPNGIDCEQLNVDITLVEIQEAFKKLKRYKTASIDGIKPEFLLDAVVALQQPLLLLTKFYARAIVNHSLLGSYMHCTKGMTIVSLTITGGSQ